MKYKIIIYFILINCVINLSLVTAKENYNHKLIYFFNQLNPNTDPINKIKHLEYDRFYIDGVQHFQIFYNPINYRNYISKQINLNPIKKNFLNNDLGNLKQQQCSKNKIKKILVTDNNIEKKIRKFKETKKTKSINNLYIAEQTFLNFKRSVFKNSFLKSNNLKAYSTSEISADKKDMLFVLKLVIPNNYNFIESNKSEVLTDIAVKIPKDINKYLKNINYRFNTTDIIEGEKNLSNFLNNISGNKILNVIYLFFEIPLDIFYNLEKNNAVNFIENINFSYIFYNDLNVIEDMSLDVSKKINFLFEKKKYRPVDLVKYKDKFFYISDKKNCLKNIKPKLEITYKKKLDFSYERYEKIINYLFLKKKLFEIDGSHFIVDRVVFKEDWFGGQKSNSDFFVIDLNDEQFTKIKKYISKNRNFTEFNKSSLIQLTNKYVINSQYKIVKVKKPKPEKKNFKKFILINFMIIIFLIFLIYSYNKKKIELKKYYIYFLLTLLIFIISFYIQSKSITGTYISIFMSIPFIVFINVFKKKKL